MRQAPVAGMVQARPASRNGRRSGVGGELAAPSGSTCVRPDPARRSGDRKPARPSTGPLRAAPHLSRFGPAAAAPVVSGPHRRAAQRVLVRLPYFPRNRRSL